MKHYGKNKGIISRACSNCGEDLNDRYKKQRYCKKCHAEWMRKNRPIHSKLSEQSRKKANARAYANVYLKRGKIKKQPCEICKSKKSQIHHDDYSKPLQIIWLCRTCHLKLHHEAKIS